MAITEEAFAEAERRMAAGQETTRAVAARFVRRTSRLVVRLSSGVEITIPVGLVEGLSGASPYDLSEIEISPAGLGLHWPKLNADVYVPALLQGVFGSTRWMAQQLGSTGGRARTAAKTASSRENGRKGGRPRKTATG